MAIIRCQACGKPNPDFLEVCQYCDARLKPLEAAPAPEAAAPPAGEKPGTVRCPACGKPNPNFLEVCQFCNARLKPLTTGEFQPAPPAGEKPGIIRCPACGKPNPDFLEVCQFCDARLKPLTAPLTAGEPQPAATGEPMDTLDRLRAVVPPPEPEPETLGPAPTQTEPDWMWTGAAAEEAKPAIEDARSAATGTPAADDWMSSLRGAAAQPVPAEEIPDWLKGASGEKPAAAPAEEIPDWLKSMREESAQPAPQPAPAADDWMTSLRGAAAPPEPEAAPAEEIPDWLKSMREEAAPLAPAAAPAEEIPDWLKPALSGVEGSTRAEAAPSAPAAAPIEEVPDWLKPALSGAEGSVPGVEAAPPSPAVSAFTPETAAPAGEMPDWLKSMRAEVAPPAVTPEPSAEEPDWLKSLRGADTLAPSAESAPAAFAPEAAPEAGGEEPDWLQSLRGAGTTTPPAEPEAPAEAPSAGAPPTAGEPDWLKALGETGAGTAEAAPAVSPFAAEEFVSPFTDQPPETPTLDTATGPMPDWLAAMRPGDLSEALAEIKPGPSAPARPPGAAFMGEGVEGLEQTALPSWLEAMRPVEVGEAQVPPETDTYQESVGLLAGMRGILRAEPAVAIPRKSTIQAHQLEVSEIHTNQAELLARLLAEEAVARPEAKPRARLVLPLERWLIFALMLVALLLPFALGPGLFPAPSKIGQDTQAAYNVIQTLPGGKPVLVAFDYDPAQSGELNPAATALVAHLMHRGVPVVGVSTRLAGAAVGDDLLRTTAAALQTSQGVSYTYGTHYLNLGYIPGGPVGLLQFAAEPRTLFQRDFAGSSAVWTTPVMTPVSKLSDFGLIVLITATPDSARAWVEQTRSYAQGVKMLAVVSAGADPLVRPYYEADPPQFAGMVSGLRGAAQYETQAGLPGAASEHWDMFGSGLLAAAVILAVGNVANAAIGLLRRRKK
jgi:hypothetical protein